MLQFRCSLDQSPLFLRVVGKHLGSEWRLAGTPRWNVTILFGHRSNATTTQGNDAPSRLASPRQVGIDWLRKIGTLWIV